MSEEQVVRHCAPTLAGLKTGSMFDAWYPSARALREDLRGWNRRLAGKGVCFLPLRYAHMLEVSWLLRELAKQGLCVVVITHDGEVLRESGAQTAEWASKGQLQ